MFNKILSCLGVMSGCLCYNHQKCGRLADVGVRVAPRALLRSTVKTQRGGDLISRAYAGQTPQLTVIRLHLFIPLSPSVNILRSFPINIKQARWRCIFTLPRTRTGHSSDASRAWTLQPGSMNSPDLAGTSSTIYCIIPSGFPSL